MNQINNPFVAVPNKGLEENNISKANKIYRLIDDNLEKLIPLAPKDLRSISNIVFDFKDKNKTKLLKNF